MSQETIDEVAQVAEVEERILPEPEEADLVLLVRTVPVEVEVAEDLFIKTPVCTQEKTCFVRKGCTKKLS